MSKTESPSPVSLAGKIALVTGSSRGLGLAIAAALAGAGAEIVLNSRDPESLGAATATLVESGAQGRAVAFDVTSSESIDDAIDYIERDIGPIDILVNAAGTQRDGTLLDFPEDRFERLLRANVISVLLVGQAVARRMIARSAGTIINVCPDRAGTSIANAVGAAAVAELTRGMTAEWGPKGLSIYGLAPPMVSNGVLSLRETPEVGQAAVLLASGTSRPVNGHILHVDGGLPAA